MVVFAVILRRGRKYLKILNVVVLFLRTMRNFHRLLITLFVMTNGFLSVLMFVSCRTGLQKKHPKGKTFRVLRKREIGGEDRVHKLIRIFSPCPWGTQGYWVSKRAAERALKMVDYYFKEPVDSFLFSMDLKFWKRSQVYSLTPAVVTEFLKGTSMRIAIDSAMETVLGKDVNADLKRSKNLCGRLSDKFICLFCDKQYHGFE